MNMSVKSSPRSASRFFTGTASEKPFITQPLALFKHLKKKSKQKNKFEEEHEQLRRTKPCIVACKRKLLNQYQGQSFGKFDAVPLASRGWRRSKSKGDFFVIHGQKRNPSFGRAEYDNYFEAVGLQHKPLLNALHKMEIDKPTLIQKKVIPEILSGSNVMACAETGSGKTLAYALPILQRLLEDRQRGHWQSEIALPKVLVVVPLVELAEQVKGVLEQVCGELELNIDFLVGRRGTRNRVKYPYRKLLDILVGTPGMLDIMTCANRVHLHTVRYCVADEADTLLDDSFSEVTCRLLGRCSIQDAPNTATATSPLQDEHHFLGSQLVMTAATVPRNLPTILQDVVEVDSMVRVDTPYIHKLMPHVRQKFLRVSRQQRSTEILKLAKRDSENGIPLMIFCNKQETSWWLSNFLRENGVLNLHLSGKVPEQERRGRFRSFVDRKLNVLVCTDICSRGLDTVHVRHVVNFEFPAYISDYIHRTGRVGRVGSSNCTITNFVTFQEDVALTQFIETAARQAEKLTSKVDANITRKLMSKFTEDK